MTEEINEFSHYFQQLRTYCDEMITRNQEEITFSSRIVQLQKDHSQPSKMPHIYIATPQLTPIIDKRHVKAQVVTLFFLSISALYVFLLTVMSQLQNHTFTHNTYRYEREDITKYFKL